MLAGEIVPKAKPLQRHALKHVGADAAAQPEIGGEAGEFPREAWPVMEMIVPMMV